jgi:hypothetical protein
MTIDELTKEAIRLHAKKMVHDICEASPLSRLLYADYPKPSAYEAFKYRVVSKVKAAVRWATYWAWEDHIS